MSIPYVRDELDTYIGQLVPQVCKAYIETRLKCVEKALEEDSLDDVFDSGLIEEHLLNLPTICRHDYLSTYTEIHSVMTPLLEQYSNALQALRNNIGNLPGDLVVRFSLLESKFLPHCRT